MIWKGNGLVDYDLIIIKCKENKMTREEAIKKVSGLPWNSPDGIIKTLETLGLIKFEEEKPKKYVRLLTMDNIYVNVYEIDLMNDLKLQDYEVKKCAAK